MAYLRDLKKTCEHASCGKAATAQLIDRWNGGRGYYCRTHATAALKEQEIHETGRAPVGEAS